MSGPARDLKIHKCPLSPSNTRYTVLQGMSKRDQKACISTSADSSVNMRFLPTTRLWSPSTPKRTLAAHSQS
eukprot:4285-Eustigmatos_ZCMA.PRE.1